MTKLTPAELLAEIERRSVHVYRDGRHYVPLFVPSVGRKTDERAAVLSALRGVEAARVALSKIARVLKTDVREPDLSGDVTEYRIDGNAMYHALNAAREALAAISQEEKVPL